MRIACLARRHIASNAVITTPTDTHNGCHPLVAFTPNSCDCAYRDAARAPKIPSAAPIPTSHIEEPSTSARMRRLSAPSAIRDVGFPLSISLANPAGAGGTRDVTVET